MMQYINIPVVFKKAFSKDFCQKIIDIQKNTSFKKGTVSEANNLNLKWRDSNIIFTDEQWIYDAVVPWFEKANKEGKYNFRLNWYEPAQVTKYDKNGFYGWHEDENSTAYPNDHHNINFRNKIRKLSCSVLLSEPNTYEGGDFNFAIPMARHANLMYKKITLKSLEVGTMIVFPSFTLHRVNPVTKGTRYSLVVWALGPTYD